MQPFSAVQLSDQKESIFFLFIVSYRKVSRVKGDDCENV